MNDKGIDPLFFDIIDHFIKTTYKLNDEEFAFIINNLDEKDIEDFISIVTTNDVSFKDKRRAVLIKQKYLNQLYGNQR